MDVIDLRSDTVTNPSLAMRRAMYHAEVGDDGFGEDPTVNRLEALAAEKLGKEAALFTASGAMSNLVAVLTYCHEKKRVILGADAHMFHNEGEGLRALAGAALHTLPNDARGCLGAEEVEKAISPDTGLIAIENTHNRCGGTVLSPEDIEGIARVASRHGIPLHLDGARIFNAAIYRGVEPALLTKHVTSVSFCLSKGLACPVGSLLCGDRDFVNEARRKRKMAGGGMRQVGIVAAAGLVALETMIERLAEDHDNAAFLAHGLAEEQGLKVDPSAVQTNIVMAEVVSGQSLEVRAKLTKAGVLVSCPDERRLRLVTHYGITRRDIKKALMRIGKALEA